MYFKKKKFNLFFRKIVLISTSLFLIFIILKPNLIFAAESKNDLEQQKEYSAILTEIDKDIFLEFKDNVLNIVDAEREFFINTFVIEWINSESITLEEIKKEFDALIKGILTTNDMKRNALAQNFLHHLKN
ncbi:hypothetical protein DH96_02520 [Candidatus Phytoplasma oryzae]|uniref:Uncharacterized protein n=1 Tax=Candidatus Phytoplasma oryzae TaxID=203274 RepID=A0A328IJZ6_9MOLU|nr:hypothetical protein [Candidatus Phytoplasma oryzae]RAM55444.1 hypothetical protein DH96_02520 [Candidatus Phytoplasma oryzae]